MALKSTIFKATLQISDLDRPYYGEHRLTLARHPSETDERMMMRLLAFALYADDRLEFGRGVSVGGEPALWLKDDTGAIRLWIEVGLPDPVALRKAAGRTAKLIVLAYGKTLDVWWRKAAPALSRLANLHALAIPADQSAALAALAARGMELQCTIQDGQVWLHAGAETLLLEPRPRHDDGQERPPDAE